MDARLRTSLAAGLVLILLGVLFLAAQLIPGLEVWLRPELWWPLIIVGIGVLLLLVGLLTSVPAMAVPACVVGGIGVLLFWQNATNNWDSWAYAWALIPGFLGVGIILSGLFSGKVRESIGAGVWLIVISLVLFTVFGSLLGGPRLLGVYWPVLLIVLGLFILIRPLFRSH